MLDTSLRPALTTALGISPPSLISSIQIERAAFAESSIDFQLQVSTTKPPAPAAPRDTPRSPEVTAQTVRGSIRLDLSVSVRATEEPPAR